jgi:hypothetical protein
MVEVMTIDLEEMYLGFLNRGCKLSIKYVQTNKKEMWYYIEIVEQSMIKYIVMLSSDSWWAYTRF